MRPLNNDTCKLFSDSETICAASESIGSMNNQFGGVPPIRSPLSTNLPGPDNR